MRSEIPPKQISFRNLSLLFIFLFSLLGCSNSPSEISSASRLVQRAKLNFQKMDAQQWESLEKSIQALESDLNQNPNRYTTELRDSANRVIADYRVLEIKRAANILQNTFQNEIDRAGKMMKELLDEDTIS